MRYLFDMRDDAESIGALACSVADGPDFPGD